MAISKRRAMGIGIEGRCTIHRATAQEKWRRTRDVTEDITGNLKEAIKVLQIENAALVTTVPPPALQTVESKRKAALKKALNKLGRALNQLSTLEVYTADMSEDMQSLQKRLEASERAEAEMSERVEAHTSTMHERVEHYKKKMQETLDRLKSEETAMVSMVKELEAARKDKAVVEEQMRLNRLQQEHDPAQNLKSAARQEDLRAENEKLKKQMTVLRKRESIDVSTDAALKDAALATATAERYKEVVAKVTADNMVFLMKLKRSEATLSSAQEKLGELQKEIDNGRAQWLEEASSEIQEVIRRSLSKAENCEAKLQELQRRQTTIGEEWKEKLFAATEKLAQVTASRDWLEKNLMDSTEKRVQSLVTIDGMEAIQLLHNIEIATLRMHRILEDEKSKLEQKYETECQHRQHAEAESRALISTFRKTSEELAEVNLALGKSLKDSETQRNRLLEKEKEIQKILADLEKANCLLETQRAINEALMKKKEEVEWELMAVEAQRARLEQNLTERPSKSYGRSSPMASFL